MFITNTGCVFRVKILKHFKLVNTLLIGAFSLTLLIPLMAMKVDAIARGYTSADSGLKVGMVAALTGDTSGEFQVERATQENTRKIVGVVTSVDDSLVTVASSDARVLVDTEGEVTAYVSDFGEPVTKGGLLAMSPIKGVLMQVPANSGTSVIGVASEAMSGETEAVTYEVDDEGTQRQVRIAKLTVNLNRSGSGGGTQADNSSLAKLGKAIVGKEVSEIRVVIALILFLVVLLAEGTIMYGAISSAITALGRNPLAKASIRRELIRILFVALLVFAVGLAAIYGILWV